MSIYCIGIVKDEDDIIGDVLLDASKWADRIYIVDNGSSDNTVEVIQSVVARTTNVEFLGVDNEPYTHGSFGKIFNRVSHISKPGDWWGRLDADEFYIDDPREFLSALPVSVDHVWSASCQFYMTDIDYLHYKNDPEVFLDTPLDQRFRYYSNNWSETRFAKHTSYFDWPVTTGWPDYMVACSNKRIRLRTYQYRTPEQIVKRLLIRYEVVKRTNGTSFSHVLKIKQSDELQQKLGINKPDDNNSIDYRMVIKDHLELDYLNEDGAYVTREESMPPLPTKRLMIPTPLLYFIKKLKLTVNRSSYYQFIKQMA